MSSRLAQMPWPVTTLHRLDCVSESQTGGIVAMHVSQAVDRALRLCMVLPAPLLTTLLAKFASLRRSRLIMCDATIAKLHNRCSCQISCAKLFLAHQQAGSVSVVRAI